PHNIARHRAGYNRRPAGYFRTRTRPTGRRTGGVVLDLDHLPAGARSELFLRAGRGNLRSGLTVHSYNLTGYEARVLRAAGVRVARRLAVATLVLRVGAAVGVGESCWRCPPTAGRIISDLRTTDPR